MLIPLLLHVALAVEPTPAVSPVVVHAALVEAAAVWAPYGVAVEAAAPCGSTHDSTVLTVDTVISPSARGGTAVAGWRGPLGAILFEPGGTPAPAIRVFLTDIERAIAAARVLGKPESEWPTTMRTQILGRVVGRVLAHEIGHYLLGSPHHAADGLMRSLQLVDDLTAPSRQRFTLTRAEAARLEEHR